MLDSQEVRKRRQEAIQQSKIKRKEQLREEAYKIFQWILGLIDENTNEGRLDSYIDVWQNAHDDSIISNDKRYGECHFSSSEVLPIVCELFSKEEGYQAQYNEDVERVIHTLEPDEDCYDSGMPPYTSTVCRLRVTIE